jgi:PAS domain S-box-containing protein
MSSTASQLQFAAELVTLLAAAAGVVLVVLRADLTGAARWARAALAAGFVAMGTAAFVHGSLLVTGDTGGGITAVRLAGDAALAGGSLRWAAGRRVRWALWAGIGLSAAAAVAELSSSLATLTDALLIAGSAGIATALMVASRRSIVARVAASSAATLLLVVLVLSVALSTVIASSAQRDELRSLSARAGVEGSEALAAAAEATKDARFVAADLAGFFQGTTTLHDLGLPAGAAPTSAGSLDVTSVADRLGFLAGLYPVGGIAYILPSGQVVTPPGAPATAARLALVARQPLVTQTVCASIAGNSSLAVETGTAVAFAAYPECQRTGFNPTGAVAPTVLLGTVLVVTPLDDAYLAGRHRIDPSTSLAIATPEAVLAAAGPQPPAGLVVSLAGRAERSDNATTANLAGRELAIEPLQPTAPSFSIRAPVAAIVLSSSDATVVQDRNRLERALFLIALGGTLIALLFVAAVGDRITAGLRRLTQVAERIRRGGTGERAGITTVDEVGTLGAAFDSMVASIEEQTAALQSAADDETRLRNRLEAVVAGMGDALVATDAAGLVTDFNAAAEELTGTTAPNALGHPAYEVVNLLGEDRADLSSRLARPAPVRWAVVGAVRRVDLTEIPVAVSAGALRGPGGELVGTVLVLRDLRREQDLERMKSEFLSRVGHEFRTPLTGIMGYAEILLHRGATPARARQWHGEILESAKRLQRIVERLEFFASSGAGRVLIQAEPLDVRAVLGGLAAVWAERLGSGDRLVRRVARSIPPVLADGRWLALAIDELIDNAVKFSPGGADVSLHAKPTPDGAFVDISVSDHGVGMSLEQQSVAFAEFVQGDGSDTRRFGGLGLGLALVARVVEGHGGSVSYVSTPGSGSTFTIRVPAAVTAETD